jgi:hypothetical protein
MRAGMTAAACCVLLAGGCGWIERPPAASWPAGPPAGRAAALGRDLDLLLPARPGYPETVELAQTILASFDGRRVALGAALALSPERVWIVLTAADGPRILTLDWTAAELAEERTALAPAGLRGAEVLAAIFLAQWPRAAVAAALPAGAALAEVDGRRRVAFAGRIVAEVADQPAGPDGRRRQDLRNFDFGYQMAIITERQG